MSIKAIRKLMEDLEIEELNELRDEVQMMIDDYEEDEDEESEDSEEEDSEDSDESEVDSDSDSEDEKKSPPDPSLPDVE